MKHIKLMKHKNPAGRSTRKMSIQTKILLPTAGVVIALSLIMGLVSYRSIRDGMVAMGVEEAETAANAAVDAIDGDLVASLAPGGEDTAPYQSQLASLRTIQKRFGIAFLYTLYTDGQDVYYCIDTDESENHVPIGDTFELSYAELADVFAGNSYAENDIDYTEDGILISVYRPIRNSAGQVIGALGCDYDASGVAQRLHRTVFRMILIALFSMLAALLVVGIIVQNIMKGLRQVDRKIYDLVNSDGDLTQQLQVNTGDELELIADNVNLVLGHILEEARIAEEVAAGNLTVRVVPQSEKDILGNALKQLVERNSNTLRNISEAAKQAKTGSSQMANASEALAQGATEQASAIEQITATVDVISRQSIQNAENADHAAEYMTLAIDKSDEGNRKMQNMVAAMKEINQASENISKIIKSIDDIAFQTNILALNASVEAARAGIHGKGFAVVAEEVRNLAAKCATAAAETSSLIEDSIRKTEAGSDIAQETENALHALTEAISQSENIIKVIATASKEQAEAVAEINRAVDQVSQSIQTNSATSQECAASSAELSKQMDMVDHLLAVYQL